MIRLCLLCAVVSAAGAGCASVPDPKFRKFTFPRNAFIGDVQRPYTVLGPVRSKVDYQSLDPTHDEKELCSNYFNRAVRDLMKYARKQGADAVIDVKSVVFLIDGRTETYPTPECSDDGGEGQVLAQGIAVKWKGGPVESGSWTRPPARKSPADTAAAAATTPAPAATIAPTPAAPAATAAAGPNVPAPSAAHPEAPVFVPGGQLVPDEDDIAATPAPAPKPTADPAAAPTDAAPVTANMEDYDPNRSLLSAPANPNLPPPQAESPQPTRSVAAAPAPAPVAPPVSPAAPASRLPWADPRAVPGTFQRAFP